MNLDFIKRRGSSAKTILDNEAYQLAVRRVRESLLNEWTMTRTKQTEERERIYTAVRVLDEIDSTLRSYASEAEYEARKQ